MPIDKSWFDEMESRIPHGEVRTRFAPSPTGYMHVGNLRTALYTWLIARHAGGKFILRIEDTDQGRLVADAVDVIYATMRRCGLTWDEGPDVGGPVGPYIQTERRDLYGRYAELLIEKGHAYRCFCTEERLAGLRRDEPNAKYDRHCLALTAEEVQAKLDAGEPYVIRQKIPEGSTTFRDAVYGDITVDNSELDDQILIKSDGLPTYNFANVIDDHLMGITHVVRGAEYLSSAPKYNLLYEAFGWDIPTYVHCSSVMIKDPETGAVRKMSKRYGDPSYQDLVEQGYLSEAVVNYVALLGWAPHGDIAEQEFFTMDQLVAAFDIEGVSKSPSAFDMDKLNYFNAAYLRDLPPEDFAREAEPWIRKAVKNQAYDAAAIAALLQARCEKLSDIPEKVDFFDALPEYGADLFTNKKSKTNAEISLEMLRQTRPVLEGLADWSQDAIHGALTGLAERLGVKNATLMWPLRIAAAGKAVTPGGAVELCRILGKRETLRRMTLGMEKLEGRTVFLETERLVLRRFREEDFEDYYAYAADKEMNRMMGNQDLTDREDALACFHWLKDREERSYAIVCKESGKVIGNLNVCAVPDEVRDRPELAGKRGASLSFCLSRHYRRRGLMEEAIRAVIDELFQAEGLDYIHCGVFDFNIPSRELQKKLGFSPLFTETVCWNGEEIEGVQNILWRFPPCNLPGSGVHYPQQAE